MIRRLHPHPLARSSVHAILGLASASHVLLRPGPSIRVVSAGRRYASEAVETAQLVPPVETSPQGEGENKEDFGGDGPIEPVTPTTPPIEASFYVSQIFPIRLGKADPRPLIASLRKDDLLDQFPLLASDPSLKSLHHFTLLKTEKQPKDGGVFLTFSFVPPAPSSLEDASTESQRAEQAVKEIQMRFQQVAEKTQGGFKTWSFWRLGAGKLWRVRGRPWHQDTSTFGSNRVRVTFEGPDVNQEVLYDLLRPFGHIRLLQPPTPQPPLTLRYATVLFSRLSSSTTAVSCLHGLSIPPVPPKTATLRLLGEGSSSTQPGTSSSSSTLPGPLTRLSLAFDSPLKAHAFRDWVSSHPRIALPVIAFLLGSLSYTFFDPIREFMVSSRLLNRFSLERSPFVKALRSVGSTLLPALFPPLSPKSMPIESSLHAEDGQPEDRSLPSTSSAIDDTSKNVLLGDTLTGSAALSAVESGAEQSGAWRERREAEKLAEGWLRESPSGFILVTGPSGSGKTALVQQVIDAENKKSLVIDCSPIAKSKSDQAMITELASQTGYWPFFGFLASANGLIDLASMGLIGQKAGFSSDFPTQLKSILDVVSNSLKKVASHESNEKKKTVRSEADRATREAEAVVFHERLRRIGYHDPRLDSLCGNGIMSELGMGDERILPSDLPSDSDALFLDTSPPSSQTLLGSAGENTGITGSDSLAQDASTYLDNERDLIEALPVVVLRNFASKGSKKDELWNTIAEWSAGLIENRIAHVVVVCDNNSASKPLSKALPSKPLNIVTLADADTKTSLAFVAAKLKLAGNGTAHAHPVLTEEETQLIGVLGGRMNDLEQVVFKVRTGGLSIRDAVSDIVIRTESELRKGIFGDDSIEAKSLPWTRSQGWCLVQALANKGEVAYQALLLSFPFKGNEEQLKALEAAELISVTTVNGRPSLVRAGKPLYRTAFKRLVDDPVFRAAQTYNSHSELIASHTSTLISCETELLRLKDIDALTDGSRTAVDKLFNTPGAVELRVQSVATKMKAAQVAISTLEAELVEVAKVLKTHH